MNDSERWQWMEEQIKAIRLQLDALSGSRRPANSEEDNMRAVLATGGTDALKNYIKNLPAKKAHK